VTNAHCRFFYTHTHKAYTQEMTYKQAMHTINNQYY